MGDNTVIIFCAHSDDQIFGVGATIAKYAKEGKEIFTYIFSFGELSHPWLKRNVSIKMRVKESFEADKVVGGKGIRFFDLKEGKFVEGAKKIKLQATIQKIILEKKPSKIFTHSVDDPHPDHNDVHNMVLKALDRIDYKCDVFTFDIWNWIAVKDRDSPRLVVDAGQTFQLKIKALRKFKSQWAALFTLLPSVYIRAIYHGIKNKMTFAEVFRKIR